MFDHVTIRVAGWDAHRDFYETVLGPLGHATKRGRPFDEWGDFSIAPASEQHRLTRRLHIAFVAGSEADVDAFWRAGTDAGYTSAGSLIHAGPRRADGKCAYRLPGTRR